MDLDVNGIKISYNQIPVLNGMNFCMNYGEVLGILGPNGSGKTTMLKCINRLLTPSQGEILIEGNKVSQMKISEIAKYIGYVPQNVRNDMASPTVFEVVMMGRSPHIAWKPAHTDEDIVWNVLESLNIKDLAASFFDELSSGQTQRVLIARAIAQEAKILLLDEPTSNLDIKYQIEVMNLIKTLSRERMLGVCAIIHDLDLAMNYCDKIILMNDGLPVAFGTPDEVLTASQIKEVYGVEAIIDRTYGKPHVIIT